MPSVCRLLTIYRLFQILLILNFVFIIYLTWNFYNSQLLIEDEKKLNVTKPILVEIWSKAAIGQYLWQDILNGQITRTVPGGVYIEGSAAYSNVNFVFRSGPSLGAESLASFSISNLVIVLNFRNEEKINYAKKWLNTIQNKKDLQNVGLIALGDEQCHNRWILDYLQTVGTKFRFLFIVYDWNQIDNQRIFQWPLGVATYRGFPKANHTSLDLQTKRTYICNYIATVYKDSSRQELNHLLKSQPSLRALCLIRTRMDWQSDETEESMDYYVNALQQSELTLSPIGMNHECYRILEAVEYGSIPVIEENLVHVRRKKATCDKTKTYRLFKKYNAPFIYISNWTKDLPGVIQRQQSKTEAEKIRERVQLVKWYHRFRFNIKDNLLETIHKNFVKK